jgi:hypothetical protein
MADDNTNEIAEPEYREPPVPQGPPKKRRVVLKRKTEEIELELADGKVIIATLKELDGPSRDQLVDMNTTRVKLDHKGKPCGLNSLLGQDMFVLERCVFIDGKLVPRKDIVSWPGSVQGAVALMIRELSNLTDDENEKMEKAKNG